MIRLLLRSYLIIFFFSLLYLDVLTLSVWAESQPIKTESPPSAETPAPLAEESVSLDTKPTVEAIPEDLSLPYRVEREKYLSKLKDDIEPNLIKGDIQRLNRNVMRLGSYRKDWVQTAQDFLVANSTLAELYIYRYALLQNKRLNRTALETLNRFQNLREPRAALAFFYLFLADPKQLVLATDLFSKVVMQDPGIAIEMVSFLNGAAGQRVSLVDRLNLGVKACKKLPSTALPQKEILKSWKTQSSQFWEFVLADELDNCLKGI